MEAAPHDQRAAPRSVALLLIWALLAVWQFWHLFHADANFLFSAVMTIGKLAVIGWCVWRGAGRVILPALRSFLVWVSLCIGGVIAFAVTAKVGGDIGRGFSLGFPCIGTFHWHHWDQALTILMIFAIILRFLASGQYRRARTVTGLAAFIFSALAVASFPELHILAATWAMFYVFSSYALLFITLFWALPEHGRLGFQRLVALELGIVLAIYYNGYNGIIIDMNSQNIPSALIFFDSAECKTPH